ncbi:MAG: GNAT family N-acetyltransferase [Candidatus Thorarchaeota archaeon]
MREEPKIRTMILEDWSTYKEIDKDIFPDDVQDEEFFTKQLEREGFFALELNGELVGMLKLALYGEDEAHLARIGVASEHQGKGFGSILMEHAIEWYRDHGGVNRVHLYTQDFNTTAQGLYAKFGFNVSGTTWHYFVPFDSLKPNGKFSCQKILDEEIDPVGEQYDDTLPAAQIRRILANDENHVMTLKDSEGNVVGASRFTPGFPGCFPFVLDKIESFDDFLAGLQPFSLPEYDYVRVTFTDYPDLAQVCEEREYKLHHRLIKMTLNLGA